MTYCSAVKNVIKYEHKRNASRADETNISATLTKHCEVTTMSANSDSTPSADSRQLSIFTPQFDERIRRIEIDGVMCFSVLDIFQHYGSKGSADNPTKYWKRAEKRLLKQGGDLPGVLQHKLPGQGGRPTPVATDAAIRAIAQLSGSCLSQEKNEIPTDGYVYVLHFRQFPNEYKIGIARDLEKRMHTYRTENPPSIKLVVDCAFYFSDSLAVEREIHAHLRDYRIRGEWFNLSDDQIPIIEQWLATKESDIMTSRALLDGRAQ